MNKKTILIAVFAIMVIAGLVFLLLMADIKIDRRYESCGGWDIYGDTVCQCSGKLVKSQCPKGALCDTGANYCYGQCGECKCYQGSSESGVEVSCENKNLLKICPDKWIDNQMPSTDINPTTTEYFIIDGERRELSEFDVEWIKTNCNIEKEIVY